MSKRLCMTAAAIALLTASWTAGVSAQEPQAAPAAQPAQEGQDTPAAPEITLENSRKMFASNCSWCHGNFGKKAGKGGPKLAGTSKDEEQVYQTILKGQNAMPSFKKTLSEDKIRALARYIKSLPAEEPAAPPPTEQQ